MTGCNVMLMVWEAMIMDRIGQERVGKGRDVGEGRGREGRLGGEVQGAVLKLVFKQ